MIIIKMYAECKHYPFLNALLTISWFKMWQSFMYFRQNLLLRYFLGFFCQKCKFLIAYMYFRNFPSDFGSNHINAVVVSNNGAGCTIFTEDDSWGAGCLIIPQHRYFTGCWIPSPCKTRTGLSCIDDAMVVDHQVAQGATTSADLAMTYL